MAEVQSSAPVPGRVRRRGRYRWAAAGLVIGALQLGACGTTTPDHPGPTARPATPPGAVRTSGTPSSALPSTTPAGSDATASATSSPSHSPSGTTVAARCADLVGTLSLREQVGQLFMIAVPTTGLSASTAQTLSDTRAGSVILLGNTVAGRASVRRLVDEVRTATPRPREVRTMIAADQEGGLVQRLKGSGFAVIPSARTQGTWSPDRLRSAAKGWGEDLRLAGVDTDLAPVADVVPASMTSTNQPIGVLRRGFGSDPAVVAGHAAAFVEGMDAAGIATATKHFPGLGRVRGNTDLVTRVVDSTTSRHDPSLDGFRSAVRAGVDMVMVSSAYYTRIDPAQRAAYSPTVIGGMLRGDLGFDGVVVSDDLAAPGLQDQPAGTRATRFLRAGGDLVIAGDPTQAAAMVDAVRQQAGENPTFRRTVADAARRVLALKADRGLATC